MVDRALGNLELFRQALKTRPMQRSERFEVSLTIPQIEGIDKTAGERDVVLFCEEIQIIFIETS